MQMAGVPDRDKFGLVGSESQFVDRILVAGYRLAQLAIGDRPDINGFGAARGNDLLAVGAEHGVEERQRRFSFGDRQGKGLDHLAVGGIPDFCGAIRTGRHDLFAFAIESSGVDRAGMSGQRFGFAGGQIPESHGLVSPAGDRLRTVGTERHRICTPGMSRQAGDFGGRGVGPEIDEMVVAGGDKFPPFRRKLDAGDWRCRGLIL